MRTPKSAAGGARQGFSRERPETSLQRTESGVYAVSSNAAVPRYYWDACVLLSYVNGDDDDRLRNIHPLLEDAAPRTIEIVTSTLSAVEVAFVATEQISRALDPAVEQTISAMWTPPTGPIKLVEFHGLIADEARGLIREAVSRGWSLKPGDAIHLATAKNLQVDALHTYNLSDFKRWESVLGLAISEPFSSRPPLIPPSTNVPLPPPSQSQTAPPP